MIQTNVYVCVYFKQLEKLLNKWNVFSMLTAQIVNLYPILNQSFVIICMHMHIYLVIPLIHHRRGRSKHTTLISFLLPRLINNSWVTIVGGASQGGGGGHPEILSLSRIPSKTGRGNQSLRPLCGEKNHQDASLTPIHTFGKRQTIFTIIIIDTTAPAQAFLSQAITFSFPSFPVLVSEQYSHHHLEH